MFKISSLRTLAENSTVNVMRILQKIADKYRGILNNYRVNLSLAPHLNLLECNRRIGEALCKKESFFVGRLGWTEGTALGKLLTEGYVPEKIKNTLYEVSGVFPITDEELKKFADIYVTALRQVNILGLMPAYYQGWLTKSYASQALRSDITSLEPYFCKEPWSWSLRGRRVLVIHPFSQLILNQYSMAREKIFSNSRILPEFTLKVIKAPQTINDRYTDYASWSETLESLKQQVRREDFDVAIIGCGAYGFPLAASVKEMGKIAIHLGGSAQLLFGIRGKRWEKLPQYQSMMTSAWSSPLESERPLGWEKIEGGCYW